MGRYLSKYLDPEGQRYGISTYPWRMAPVGLATRRQLTALGLRPGGQPVAAQVMWRSTRKPSGVGVAYLYHVEAAKPKRAVTPAQRAALDKALAARRRCPKCGNDPGYVLARRLGTCNPCADPAGWSSADIGGDRP